MSDRSDRERLYSHFRLFHRPADRERLIGEMRDDADMLIRGALILAEEEQEQLCEDQAAEQAAEECERNPAHEATTDLF